MPARAEMKAISRNASNRRDVSKSRDASYSTANKRRNASDSRKASNFFMIFYKNNYGYRQKNYYTGNAI
jgi:hypothetical protein